jgi:Hg(II)-responsive transcriptional regulator
MNRLTIGQVAKKARVNVMTVRYYERRGLIPEPPRLDSGYRQYLPETVRRIFFIKSAQELGFSLREIEELLSLRVRDDDGCGEVKRKAQGKIAEIEEKIGALTKMKRALTKLTAACETRTPSSGECPILDALEPRFTGDEA